MHCIRLTIPLETVATAAPRHNALRSCAWTCLRQAGLFIDNQPFRLLLAYTSAKAFLLYETDLGQRGIAYEDIVHRISVINRGSWGELRFRSLHP